MDRTLWHLTLDTMHAARTARSEVSDHVVEHLAGVLARARATGRPVKMVGDDPNPYAVRLLREGDWNSSITSRYSHAFSPKRTRHSASP